MYYTIIKIKCFLGFRGLPAGPRENSQIIYFCVHGGKKAREITQYLSGFFCAKERENIIMEWITLLIAGMFEISWAIGLKFSHGFSRPIPSVITVVCMIASFYFLALALKSLPLGTAYAVWTGIGTLGTVILGIILFKEPVTVVRLFCIALIVSGITGLKLVTH